MKFSMTRQEKGFLFYASDWIAEVTSDRFDCYLPCICSLLVWFMVFNATFNNISVTQEMYTVAVSFIGGGNWSTRRNPPSCRRSLTHFIR